MAVNRSGATSGPTSGPASDPANGPANGPTSELPAHVGDVVVEAERERPAPTVVGVPSGRVAGERVGTAVPGMADSASNGVSGMSGVSDVAVRGPAASRRDPVGGGVVRGRTARTKGVSLLPTEYDDATTLEELTGVGFSEVYHRFFAPQMRAAADLLRQAQAAGMELDRAALRDTWDVHMTVDELASVYVAESELESGG